MSYNIFTLENGQPVILHNNNNNLIMYTISSGRVMSRGIVLNDVSRDFAFYNMSNQYIYYISTNNRIKISRFSNMSFTEILSLSIDENSIKKILKPCILNNNIYLFYETENDNMSNLYCASTVTVNNSSLILSSITNINSINAYSSDGYILLVLAGQKSYLWKFFPDMTLYAINGYDSESSAVQKELEKRVNEQITEITQLKHTQKHIAAQYNELAEYASKLQEEFRKYRIIPR